MSDIDGSARSENGKNVGIAEASSVFGAELDLETEAKSVNTQILRGRQTGVIYPGTIERRASASGISDAKGIFGERVQDSTGIVEEFQGLVTGVGDGRGDLQVLQPVDVHGRGRGPDGQAGGSRDGDRRGDEGDERRAEGGGEHCEGVRGDMTAMKTVGPGLNSFSSSA